MAIVRGICKHDTQCIASDFIWIVKLRFYCGCPVPFTLRNQKSELSFAISTARSSCLYFTKLPPAPSINQFDLAEFLFYLYLIMRPNKNVNIAKEGCYITNGETPRAGI